MGRAGPLLVVGDLMLDSDLVGRVDRVAPDAPVPVVDLRERRDRPGGAGLAALLLAGRRDRAVTLACAVADDAAGRRACDLLARAGVRVVPLARATATRRVTRLRSAGQSLLRVDENAPHLAAADPVDVAALDGAGRDAGAVLVADYGAGVSGHPDVRTWLALLGRTVPVVWDPHPRGAAPVPGTTVATPNRAEALRLSGLAERARLDDAATALLHRWPVRAVAATDGAAGVLTALAGSPPLFTPVPAAVDADPCGAGDRFAGALAAALADGTVVTEAVERAVADVARWLGDGGVGALDLPVVALGPTAAGPASTVVATGGCFDVLHAGHVASLEAARRLGDRLVVLVNSDDSIRRLKGPGRPVNPVADRVRVLRGLGCVDEVRVFDDDTPERALADLRPDVWAKGGDYTGAGLPEADLVRSWGGRVVLLPYLPGRSTTSILAHTATP